MAVPVLHASWVLLVGLVAYVHAQDAESCEANLEDANEGAAASSCGCGSLGRDGGAPVTQEQTEQQESRNPGTGQFDNRTADACSSEPFYEGYRVGCIHSYSDNYTGLVDCGMVRIRGGPFRMGTDFLGQPLGKHNLARRYMDNSIHGANPSDAEAPSREAEVESFEIDVCEVTTGQFKEFADATGYVTDAELYGWSFVLEYFLSPEVKEKEPNKVRAAPWWRSVTGASWRAPEGPGSSPDHLPVWYGVDTEGVPNEPEGHRWNHPVSHISWRDAYNFCRWRGKRLPREAEWEYAARGGLDQKMFPWGDDLYPGSKHRMNVWQGDLPEGINTAEDGYRGTSATASYPPNDYGLYDMTGNIWEWVHEDFTEGQRQQVMDRPETQVTLTHIPLVMHKTKRGGSHMCHASTCNRYRTSGRTGLESDSSAGNLGFRCARDVD